MGTLHWQRDGPYDHELRNVLSEAEERLALVPSSRITVSGYLR